MYWGKKFTNCVLKLTIVLEAALIRDGNGYIPVGYWPPIPVPARTKFYPSGYPYPYTGRKTFPYPYPAGNLYPTGNPYPKSIPENYI